MTYIGQGADVAPFPIPGAFLNSDKTLFFQLPVFIYPVFLSSQHEVQHRV